MELFVRSATVVLGASAIAVGMAAILSLATFGRKSLVSRFQAGLASSLLLLPCYVIAGAWSAGFGSMGWWTLSQVSAAKAPLVGIASVVWIHAMAATPVAFWLLVVGLQLCPRSMVELAILNGGSRQQFIHGIWPRWSLWMIGSFFLIAAWVSGDMVVTNLFQITTLTEQCYLDRLADSLTWRRTLAASSLSIGLGLAGLSVFRAFSIDRAHERQPDSTNSLAWGPDWLGYAAGWTVVGLVVGIPFINLVIKAGWTSKQLDEGIVRRAWSSSLAIENIVRSPIEYAEEFRWSSILASASATLACALAASFLLAIRCTIVRFSSCDEKDDRSLLNWSLALLLVCFALPGPIVNSLMIGLFSLPVAGLSWLNDHTLAAPVLCLQFRLVPLAFFAMVILEKQWQRRVGDVWRFDKGKPSLARMRIFLLWMAKPTCTVWVLLFAIAFGDLSSYLQCLPPGVTPVSMRIFDLLHYGVRSSEAGLLLFLALLGSGLGWWLHRNLSQRLP